MWRAAGQEAYTVRHVDTMKPFDVVVLAGGGGRRLGGVDKASVAVGDLTMLDRVLSCCAGAREVVVVGPERPTPNPVRWTMETPPGSGPVAGIAAGMAALTPPKAPTVGVLATDLPYLTSAAVHALVRQRTGDGVMYEDADGQPQPLCAAYEGIALATALRQLPFRDGASVRSMLAGLNVRTITDDDGVSRDVDTPTDLGAAQVALDDPEANHS